MTSTRTAAIAAIAALVVVLAIWGPPPKGQGLGNVLHVSSLSAPDSLDPAISYQAISWETMVNIYNGLLTYRKTDGTAGAQPVPDLATSLPRITEGGRTYSLTMRRGIRFAPPANREVLPSDVKYAIERGFRANSPGQGFFQVIEGAEAFAAKKADTITGITVDDRARTIRFRLVRPDPTFTYVLALPFASAVPKGTPPKDQSQGTLIPGTGPYMYKEYVPLRRIVLVRNPNFRSWSPDTPDGNVDGVHIRLGVDPENAVTLIQRGKLDYMLDAIPRSRLPGLLADPEWKQRVYQHEVATTSYIYFNTKVKPFDNVKLRKAVNWAIDRRAMVKLSGGLGVPSSTILPTTMPGYADHGLYDGPDLDKARTLVRESGVTPGKVKVWCRTNPPNPDMAVYLQSVLTDLGFTATVQCVDSANYFTLVGNDRTKASIGLANWGQDFPEGSNFMDVLLNGRYLNPEHNNNLARYTGADKQIDKVMRTLDQRKRDKAWGALDRTIMERDAPWAPFMHGVTYRLVSERLGDYTHSPMYDLFYMKVSLKGEERAAPPAPAASTRRRAPA